MSRRGRSKLRLIEGGDVVEIGASAAETHRCPGRVSRGQFFTLIDQVQERTHQVPVAELEESIAESVEAAKRGEKRHEGQPW